MNARGSTEVIIASIGLSIGALSQMLFDDRHNGCVNHLRNAADVALGVVAGAAAAR